MKWEDLTDREKGKWDEIAKKYQKSLLIIDKLSKTNKCFMCRKRFETNLLINFRYDENKRPIKLTMRGDFQFHLYETHGLPTSFFNDQL